MAAVASAASQIAASRGLPTDTNTNTTRWLEEAPPPLEEDAKRLFLEYSKIPEQELEQHLVEAVSTFFEALLFHVSRVNHTTKATMC